MTARSPTEQLKFHATVLRDLSRRGSWHFGNRRSAFAELCEVAANTLDVERVSIWLYDEDRLRIVCANLYERSLDRHASGMTLVQRDYPDYFAALEKERSIAAHDAATDARTREFVDSYLAPLGITSLLDAPIQTGGQSVGVVCHEHVGIPRTWTHEEETFAATIGDFAALTLEVEQRRIVERRLSKSNMELRLALQAATMGIWAWELESDRITVSDEVSRIFGQPDAWQPGRSEDFIQLAHPEDRDRVRLSFRRVAEHPRVTQDVQYRIVLPDQSVRWVEVLGQREAASDTERIVGTISDRTERRELEGQLLQAQKMEGIGQLAGGIAHDFNNLLLVIFGYTESLLDRAGLTESQTASVKAIQNASERAAALIGQLLSFARRQPLKVSTVNLSDLVHGLSQLLERLLGETVELVTHSDSPISARVDPSQLEQVLINLCINARDAMESGGRLEIAIEPVELLEDNERGSLAPGSYACIRVTDEGSGIPAELLERVFEPFFTTKAVGHGTGLGLATCYGIVRQANGDIRIQSTEGAGTTVRVYLPRSEDPTPTRVPRHERGGLLRGSETILVVEDEGLVRELLVTILSAAGYRILAAADAREALDIVTGATDSIQMIVTDVVLPGMSGVALVEELRRSGSSMAVLYLSGYALDAAGGEQIGPSDELLSKPFMPDQLTDRVRAILDQRAGERK